MTLLPRARLGLACAAAAIAASLIFRYFEVVAHAGSDFADFTRLHGQRLLLELPDTRLNSWILAWVFHAAATDPSAVYEANALHPTHAALTGSEHLFGIALQMWPLRIFTSNAIALHQLSIVASSALLAFTSFLGIQRITASTWAALAAGLAAVWMPWRVTEISHLQLLSAQFIPFVWICVLRGLWGELEQRQRIALGVAVALQLLSSFYLAYFLTFSIAVILAVGCLAFRPTLHSLIRLAASVAPGYALFVASALPYLQRQRGGAFDADGAGDAALGAVAWTTFVPSLGSASELLNPAANYHLPWAVGLLALLSLAHWHPALRCAARVGADARESRCGRATGYQLAVTVAALFAICALAVLMMPGKSLAIGGRIISLPAALLATFVPGFELIRGTVRWGILVCIAAPLLAGLGVAAAERMVGGARRRKTLCIAALLGGLLASFDYYTVPTTPAWSDPEQIRRRYAQLGELGPGVLLEIPWAEGLANSGFGSRSMLASTLHWRPLVNGYTGHQPEPLRFLQRIGTWLPARVALERVVDLAGVRFILIDRHFVPKLVEREWELALRDGRLRLAHRDDDTLIVEIPGWETGGRRSEALAAESPRSTTLAGLSREALQLAQVRGSLSVESPTVQQLAQFMMADVSIGNRSAFAWPGYDPSREGLLGLRYSYWHVEGGKGGQVARTAIAPLDVDVLPGERVRVRTRLRAPNLPGRYQLCSDLVQQIGGALVRLPIPSDVRTVTVDDRASEVGDRFAWLFDRERRLPPCERSPAR